jgi:hypothetical protein
VATIKIVASLDSPFAIDATSKKLPRMSSRISSPMYPA